MKAARLRERAAWERSGESLVVRLLSSGLQAAFKALGPCRSYISGVSAPAFHCAQPQLALLTWLPCLTPEQPWLWGLVWDAWILAGSGYCPCPCLVVAIAYRTWEERGLCMVTFSSQLLNIISLFGLVHSTWLCSFVGVFITRTCYFIKKLRPYLSDLTSLKMCQDECSAAVI